LSGKLLDQFPITNDTTDGTEAINSLTFSPDDKRIVIGTREGTVQLLTLSSKNFIRWRIDSSEQSVVIDVRFSPDGKYIATSGFLLPYRDKEGDKVQLWSLLGKQLVQFRGHNTANISFSHDSKALFSSGLDGTVRLWDLSGKQLYVWKHGNIGGATFAVSSDGKYMAAAGPTGQVLLWKISDRKQILLGQWRAHRSNAIDISFSPDSQLLATAGTDGEVRMWNLSGKQVAEFIGHQGGVQSIAFSPNGKSIATVGFDGMLWLWPVENLDELLAKGCSWLKDYLAVHPDAPKLCSNQP